MLPLAVLLWLSALAASLASGGPTERAWSVLHQGLENKSADKRAQAVHALGALHGNASAEVLAEKALNDASSEVRVEAASALGQMKAAQARPKLRLALRDKELKVVLAAAEALYVLKDPAAYQVYYALLTGERKSSETLLQTQMDTLRDRKQMEKMAFETGIGFVPFGGMGWQAWKTITQDDSSPIKAVAAQKLASDPDATSAEGLVNSSADKKWRVRAAVANAIGLRGDPKLLDTVASMLLDENDTVRYQAAAAVIDLTAHPRKKSAGRVSSNSGR